MCNYNRVDSLSRVDLCHGTSDRGPAPQDVMQSSGGPETVQFKNKTSIQVAPNVEIACNSEVAFKQNTVLCRNALVRDTRLWFHCIYKANNYGAIFVASATRPTHTPDRNSDVIYHIGVN